MRSRNDRTRLTGRHSLPPLLFVVFVPVVPWWSAGVSSPIHPACAVMSRFPCLARTSRVAILCTLALVPTALLCAQVTALTVRYRVSSTAVIALERSQQTPLVDTITTASVLTIATAAAADTVATMSVDSLVATSTGMVRRAESAFRRGLSVAASLNRGRPRITGDSATACATERPLAGLLPELLPLLPDTLSADRTWADTLTVTTCRAGLPATTVTIVASRTLTGMDSTTLLLERHAVIRVTGNAVLRDQMVTLQGSGTSESLAVLGIADRRIMSWRGTQTLEFEITNGQQVRRLVQQLTENAALLP